RDQGPGQLGDVPPPCALVHQPGKAVNTRDSRLFWSVEPISLAAMEPFCRFAILALASSVAFSDTVQLKDDASITGRVIAEKTESVAVDVGYTVLMVPRSAIVKIVTPKEDEKTDESKAPKGPNTTPPASAQL